MPGGLCVVGAALGAGEVEVARALAGGRLVVAPVLLGAGGAGLGGGAGPGVESSVALALAATPLVAARHARAELDPRELVARGAAVRETGGAVALSGGPLAPLTPRYAVRDLARELELPAVVAVRPAPGFPALALGAAQALRALGVAVVAVVVAGWPEPPDRVQLDEHDALREVADVPVETLAAGGAALDPSPWLAAVGPGAPVTTVREVALEPYRAWEARDVPDPRSAPRPQTMATLLEIVAAEGPMLASRAYALYNRAAGGRKLTSVARAPLSSALYWLARDERVVLVREADAPWQGEDVARAPDAPAVRVRELGPRTLDEVPLDEVAELVRRLRAARGLSRADQLKRAVLDAYGLVRLTAKANEYLDLALDLAEK